VSTGTQKYLWLVAMALCFGWSLYLFLRAAIEPQARLISSTFDNRPVIPGLVLLVLGAVFLQNYLRTAAREKSAPRGRISAKT